MKLQKIAQQAIKNLIEDWMFIPITGGGSPVLDPQNTLSKLRPVPDKENVMPKYKNSTDAGIKKTEKVIRKVRKANRNFCNNSKPKMKSHPYR